MRAFEPFSTSSVAEKELKRRENRTFAGVVDY
jgi:hypothetical protein